MSYVDQFIASIGFQFKKVAQWRNQTIWKSILYICSLILLVNLLVSVYRLSNPVSIKQELRSLPESYTISKDGTIHTSKIRLIRLPQIDTLLTIGETKPSPSASQGLKNVVVLGKKKWAVGRVGYPLKEMSYDTFPPLLNEKDGILSKKEIVELSGKIDQIVKFYAPIYQYARVALNLIVHFILISLLAFAGRSFRKMVPITYGEAWTITAYGITAPIVLFTLIQLMGLNIPILPVLYWVTVGIFSLWTIRQIDTETEEKALEK